MRHTFPSLLAASFALAGCVLAASADTPKSYVTVIHAGHLIAAPGEPVREHQSILVQNGKIVAIKDGYVAGDKVVDLTDRWVLPGFIDMHTHVSLRMDITKDNPRSVITLSYISRPAEEIMATLDQAHVVLRNGFTTIRNLGDPADVTYALGKAINAGIVQGPRIIASEPQFEVNGGDYEASQFGGRKDLEHLWDDRGTCTGVVECTKVTRSEIRRGAGVIKLRLSAFTMIDPKSKPMETPEELRAIIETAHRLHRTVATHSIGSSAANEMAIEAGTDSLEHGPLSDENIRGMKKYGTAFTPTLMAAKMASDSEQAKELPDLADAYPIAVDSLKRAYKAGVPIIFGTDLPFSPTATEGDEFLRMAEAGMTPVDILKSATTTAAKVLGMADTLGSIAPGKAADIVAVPGDPLEDVHQLTKVDFVMQSGKVFYDPKVLP